jgi:GntR family transcriptional regulator
VFDDHSPIYQQIAQKVRDDVVAGALRPGEQVMSTNQYAAFHRINPATVGKAFQQLVDEGVLEKRRGIGMFVTPGADEHLRAQRRSRFVDRYVAPLLAEAERLGLTVDEVIAEVRDAAGFRRSSA